MTQLLEAIGDVKKTDDVTAVILRSGHPGSFCAGELDKDHSMGM